MKGWDDEGQGEHYKYQFYDSSPMAICARERYIFKYLIPDIFFS